MKRKRRSRQPAEPGTLGRRIYDLRTGLCMTQAELAEKVGCTQSAVAAWERNITIPRLCFRQGLAGELNVRVPILFDLGEYEKAKAAS